MHNAVFPLGFIGPGGPEFLLVMLVLLMMFGAKDAPRILRKLNEIISQIRNTADGFKREVMYGDLNSDTPSDEEEYSADDDYAYEDDYSDEHGYPVEDDTSAEKDSEIMQEGDEDENRAGDSHDEPEPESEDSLDEDGDAEKT